MSRPKKTSETELLKELLETAALSGDVQRLATMRSVIGEWTMRRFMPEVADMAQSLEGVCRKSVEPQLININNPSGDVILTGGKKEEKNFKENTETNKENL